MRQHGTGQPGCLAPAAASATPAMLESAAGHPAQVSPQPPASGRPQKPEALATIARLSTLGSRKFGGAAKDPVLDSLCRLLGSVLRCKVSGAARRCCELDGATALSCCHPHFFLPRAGVGRHLLDSTATAAG